MEESSGDHTSKENPQESVEHGLLHVESQDHDVDKTLYDAEEFLASFAVLREENEQLKQANQQLELQLGKAHHDLQQMTIQKSTLENQILQERDQNKEMLWKLRSDFQKVQEERLQWKEKYLDSCLQSSTQPTGLPQPQSGFYTNLSASFGLTDQEQQSVPPVTNQLWDPETKRFECKECKATFRMFSDLQTHVDKNKCVKYTFQCPQCSVAFNNAATFTKHLKYHMGKSMQCDYCGDKFMHEKGLKRHIKMYHTEFTQSFTCQYCPKVFGRKTLLENHIRRHFDYRPYKCPHCEKSFKTRQYLTGHINGVHKNDKQFVCDKCDARFSWRTTWKRHMQNHLLKDKRKKSKRRAAASTVTLSTVVENISDLQQQLAHNTLHLSHDATLTQDVAGLAAQSLNLAQHGQLTVTQLTQDVTQLPQ